jgi:hypothetical protein
VKQLLIAAAAASALLLAACGDKAEAPAADATAATETPVAPVPAAAAPAVATGDAFATPLPGGVVLPEPYHARNDVLTTSPKGVVGRRTEYEYLEGDAAKAMATFAAAAAAAGYVKADDAQVDDKGVVRQSFKKKGFGTVQVRAQDSHAKHLKHPAAIGVVFVSWPRAESAVAPAAVATN